MYHFDQKLGRRAFLKGLTIAGAATAAVGVAGCGPTVGAQDSTLRRMPCSASSCPHPLRRRW